MQAVPGDADLTGFVMPFDGLIFGFMLHVQRVANNLRNVCIMIDDAEAGCIGLQPQGHGKFKSPKTR